MERVYDPDEDDNVLSPKTNPTDNTRDVLKPKPLQKINPKLKLRIISILELGMNVKKVIKNLEIKKL